MRAVYDCANARRNLEMRCHAAVRRRRHQADVTGKQPLDLLAMLSDIEPDLPALLICWTGYLMKSGDHDDAVRYLNRIGVSRASPEFRRAIVESREELEGSSR